MVRCKKALSLFLALVMMLGMIPFNMNANATEGDVTIVWTDESGNTASPLDSQTFAQGEKVEYKGEVPTKASEANRIWVFQGWEVVGGSGEVYYNTFPKAENDTVYKAKFKWFDREYRVSFVNYNGEEVETATATYGKKLKELFPTTPTAPGVYTNAKYEYVFDDWYNGGKYNGDTVVSADMTFRARYTPKLRNYEVKYSVDDGATETSLGTTFHYGDTPTLPVPSKTGETFIGWSPAVGPITGDTTYTALFKSNTSAADENHTVYFVTADGVENYTVKHGETAAAIAAQVEANMNPKAADAWNTYAFDGWLPATDTAITEDTVFVAQYPATERSYDVVWMNGDNVLDPAGDTTKSCTYDEYLAYVDTLVTTGSHDGGLKYDDVDPSWERPDKSYVFTGWMDTVNPRKGTVTMAAQSAETSRKYPVIFVDDDGRVLDQAESVQYVPYGEEPKAHPEPTKENSDQSYYVFDGWKLTTVSDTRVYTANYNATDIPYEVWCEYKVNGGTVETKQIGTGTYTWDQLSSLNIKDEIAANGIVVPDTYTAGSSTYEFVKWEKTSSVDKPTFAESKVIFTAQYQVKVSGFTIVWENYDGTGFDDPGLDAYSNLSLHSSVTAPDIAPEKPSTAQYDYTFDGWDGSDGTKLAPNETFTVTGDATYTARFKPTTRSYTVRWLEPDGTEIASRPVEYGEKIGYQAEPAKAADRANVYAFAGWDPAFDSSMTVTEDKAYNFTATYTATPREYTIQFIYNAYDESGALVETGELLPTMTGMHYLDPIPYDKSIENEEGKPTLPETLKYTYTPQGWVRRPDQVDPLEKSDGTFEDTITFVAEFDANTKKYPVKWITPGQEKPLSTKDMPLGADPNYVGDTSILTYEDGGITYVFDHWEPQTPGVNSVTADPAQNVFVATYSPMFKITWNYPDPDNGDDLKETVPTPGSTPVVKPDDVPYDNLTWVDADYPDDPTKAYDPDNPQTPSKNTTYIPVFTITWDNPTDNPADVEDKVPYKQTVTKPDNDKLEDTVENQPWAEKDDPNKTPFAEHPATKDETYKPIFNITWEYPDDNGDPIDVVDPVPYDEDVIKPDDQLPDDVENRTWVNKDDPTDVYDPTNPQKPTGDKTYVPLYTITWGDPDKAAPYKVDQVPYGVPVTKPDDADLPDEVDGKPDADWLDKLDNDTPYKPDTPTDPHPATKDETYVPLFNITWEPNNNGKDPVKNEKVKQGVTPVYDETAPNRIPAKSGYNSKGWSPAPYPANKDQTYTAQYTPKATGGGGGGDPTPTKSTIPITWDVNGTKTVTNVPKGDMPVYPNGTPTKDNALFVRWTPEVVPATEPATYRAVFTDSPDYHARPEETGIDKLLETGEHVIYYRGYPDGTIQPYGNITRGETAMILYRLLLDKDVKIDKSFNDVTDDAWYATAVLTLASLGIVTGNPEGNFRPNDAITRAEFTAMCIRFVKAQEAHFEFTDVKEDFWAYKEIMTAAYYGWITGYPDGSFRPNAFIARCEAAAVVNRMLGRVADQEYVDKHESELIYFPDLLKEWYYYEMIEGTNAHDYDIVNEKETWKTMYDK